MTTWTWIHGQEADPRDTPFHDPDPDLGAMFRHPGDGDVQTACLTCKRVLLAHGSSEDEPAQAGHWTVEDGNPYWEDDATNAMYHPMTMRLLSAATQHQAFHQLAELISPEVAQ